MTWRSKRPALFEGYWFRMDGTRIGRASQQDLREAGRLWWKHKDLRLPKPKPRKR